MAVIYAKCEDFTVNKPQKEGDPWTVTARYVRCFDDGDKCEYVIDQMPLSILPCPDIRHPHCSENDIWRVNLGFGELKIPGNEFHYREKTIKTEKTREMTLADVEKERGYKVRIISEEEL